MDFGPAGSGRMVVALVVLVVLAALAWQTMEPGNFRSVTLILLGFFAIRVALLYARSR